MAALAAVALLDGGLLDFFWVWGLCRMDGKMAGRVVLTDFQVVALRDITSYHPMFVEFTIHLVVTLF